MGLRASVRVRCVGRAAVDHVAVGHSGQRLGAPGLPLERHAEAAPIRGVLAHAALDAHVLPRGVALDQREVPGEGGRGWGLEVEGEVRLRLRLRLSARVRVRVGHLLETVRFSKSFPATLAAFLLRAMHSTPLVAKSSWCTWRKPKAVFASASVGYASIICVARVTGTEAWSMCRSYCLYTKM